MAAERAPWPLLQACYPQSCPLIHRGVERGRGALAPPCSSSTWQFSEAGGAERPRYNLRHMAKPLKTATSWRFHAAAPPREVFATMEQLLGVPPYRFQQLDANAAEVVEIGRIGLAGNWSARVKNPGWVRVEAVAAEHGTLVQVSVSVKPFALSRGGRIPGAGARALQLVNLLTEGAHDYRTVYRDRRIPAGPVTLVASWAGTPYLLFLAPRFDSSRGTGIRTATRLVATGEGSGPFIKVELADGSQGWIERDQCVPAPAVSTRDAQAGTAVRAQTY